MAPELTRLDAKLVEGKYHLLLHFIKEQTENNRNFCETLTLIVIQCFCFNVYLLN